jgi:hypothetical protein
MRFHTTEFDFLPELAFRPRPGGGMTLEGGKGSDAPPPDPRLVAAQIKSMGIQDSAIERIMSNSEAMMPLQREQMQFGLDASRTAYGQSQEDRQWSLGRRGALAGLQDTLVSDAKSFNAEDRADQLSGQAQGDVNQAFSNARDQGARAMSRMGVNPSSGRAAAMSAQTSIAQAAALAGASQKARAGARAEGYALTDRATNALAGFPAMASANTGAGAGFGVAGLGVANQGLAGMNGGFQAGAGVAGNMGNNATSMFNAQGSYKNQQDQIAGNDPLLGAVGQVAGMWAASSYTLKDKFKDMKPGEGLDMVETMPVKRWSYKEDSGHHDGQEHIGPMAENVQQVAGDEVAPGGKAIDLISMNGITMHAVQDLSREIKSIKRLLAAGGMRQQQTEAA